MKNYIFIFVAAFMLLGTQSSVFAADRVLTVTGGTGSGTYADSAMVDIVADPAPSGMVFDRWVFTDGKPMLDSIYNATAKLKMPATDVAIKALYMANGPFFDDCETLTTTDGAWKSGPTLNTTDMLQGAGCFEYDQAIGNSTTLFQKTITAGSPINTGATLANGVVRLRFWIEDPTKLGNLLSIELRSGGELLAEHQWNITKASVLPGWNNFNLKFSASILAGTNLGCDPSAVTFFRIYSQNCVGVKAKLDGLMVYDPVVATVDPVVTWANPADVAINTALTGTQLNASANVVGTYAYTPALNTVLTTVETKQLSVIFKPANIHQFIYNSVTKTVDINVVESISAVNNPSESAFKMYPNPVKNNGLLNFEIENETNYTLKISNMNGQTVYSNKLNSSHTFNVNGILKQGAYIVSLITNNTTRNQKLFIE